MRHKWDCVFAITSKSRLFRISSCSLSGFRILEDVRAIGLTHLSPRWSPGLIWLIWLARQVSPSSLCVPLEEDHPDRGNRSLVKYMSSCSPLLERPDKLSRAFCRGLMGVKQASKTLDTSKWGMACSCLPFRKSKQACWITQSKHKTRDEGWTVMSWSLAQEGASRLHEIGEPGRVTDTLGGCPQLLLLGPWSKH